MISEDPKVVTLSREALRADLAEMELRLRIWISHELGKKADESAFALLHAQMTEWPTWRGEQKELLEWKKTAVAGHFTDAQVQSMKVKAQEVLDAAATRGLTDRQRMIAILVAVITIALTIVNVYFNFQQGAV